LLSYHSSIVTARKNVLLWLQRLWKLYNQLVILDRRAQPTIDRVSDRVKVSVTHVTKYTIRLTDDDVT
jgi:hypothetical protein